MPDKTINDFTCWSCNLFLICKQKKDKTCQFFEYEPGADFEETEDYAEIQKKTSNN